MRSLNLFARASFGLVALLALPLCDQLLGSVSAAQTRLPRSCADCDQWNQARAPFRIYGNTYYVGTAGLSAILITSDYGHVLIDGALPESAPLIASSIEKLGFKLSDVKAILNTHAHIDHAGGIAELQRRSNAAVYALRPANEALTSGKLPSDDPQAQGKLPPIPKVSRVWVVHPDQQLGVGSIRVKAIHTPGHTPGGTSWTWESCVEGKCLAMVYADSLNPVSSDKYRFTDHPEVVAAFQGSYERLSALRCDVLMTPHPGNSQLFERLARSAGAPFAADAQACKRLVQASQESLKLRLAAEQASRAPR
jgi:metallo-beta-lactamase class B